MHTSYASRMRTGASMLVQPIIGLQSGAPIAVGGGGGRSRRVVNYAETGSADEMDDDDTDSSADSENEQQARRGRPRRDQQPQGQGQFSAQATPAAPVKVELDQSYLGQVPPAKFITSKFAVPTKHDYYPQHDVDREARKPTVLVPVRVEVDTETLRVRDAFVWNLNEELITPQQFARAFCTDLDIPLSHVDNVAGAIRAQLDEHAPIAAMDLRGALFTPEGTIDHFAEGPGEDVPDCRVILSIDVQIDARHLVDHIEWDLLSPLSPEDFAKGLCADIGLSGEAVPLVAHAVHEELLKHKRDALEWGLLDDASGAYVRNMGLGGSGWGKQGNNPRRLKSVWREWTEIEEYGFCPRLEILSQDEIERREVERERASRRLRRETSRFQNVGSGRRRR